MSRAQVFDMLQRQVANSGGCYDGGEGGLFSPQARAGQHAYQVFRQQNAGLSREEMKHAWAAHKHGGALVGGRMGGLRAGALMGGFPGQRAQFAALKKQLDRVKYPGEKAADRRDAQRRAFAAEKQALTAQFDIDYPNWRLFQKPRKSYPKGDKDTRALLKQIKAASIGRPDCEVFGLKAAERADYHRLRGIAQHLGIPVAPLPAPPSRARKDAALLEQLMEGMSVEV
jgi:hypothetical protein